MIHVPLGDCVIRKLRLGNFAFMKNGEMTARTCTNCRKLKSRSHFSTHNKGFNGLYGKCMECRREYGNQWTADNKELTKIRRQARSDEFKESERIRLRKYYLANKDWLGEINRERNRKHYKDKPEMHRLNGLRRRAMQKSLPNDLTNSEYKSTLEYFGNACAITGETEDIHADHVIPISIGHGGTTKGNMVPLTSKLNFSKNNRNVFEWFNHSKDSLNLSQSNFDTMISYLAKLNGKTISEYRDYVYWCHENEGKTTKFDEKTGG